MTKLESEVTRITALVVDGREVDVTLVPGSAANLVHESIRFHQKGLKSSVTIPLPVILKAIGWEVEGFKRMDDRDTFSRLFAGERVSFEEISKLCESLEREFGTTYKCK